MSKLKEISAVKLKEVFGETDVLIIKGTKGKEDLSCMVGDLTNIGVEMASLLKDVGEKISDDKNEQVEFIEMICKAVIEMLSPVQNDSSPKEEPEVGMMDGILGNVQVSLPKKLCDAMAKPAKIVYKKPEGIFAEVKTEIKGEKAELYTGVCFLLDEIARNEYPDDLGRQSNYIRTACECVIQILEIKHQQEKKVKKE